MSALAPQRVASLAEARRVISVIEDQLARAGIGFRAPPPIPDSCCGRGCQGCVWEGYYAALNYWQQQACAALAPA